MDLIIDGYNVIANEQGLNGSLEHRRNWLVQRLSLYRTVKNFNVMVVFDGWRSGSAVEVSEKQDRISVIYSRLGEKADQVIVRMARQKGGGSVIVTSDREIRTAVERFDAVAIHAADFSKILRGLDRFENDSDDGEIDIRKHKTGNPNRLSKVARRRQEKLKKLAL